MTTDARELKLYIDSDETLYRQMTTSIFKNLATKRARGDYKHDLAVKAFGYLVEAGAKKYAKDFGSPNQPWNKMFDVATRKQVAEQLTHAFESEAKLGNYDHLLPKKYQAKESSSAHARTKITWKVPTGLKVTWSPVNSAYFALWPASAPTSKQQVLKIADAAEMHDWLRSKYGSEYGRAGRTSLHARKRAGYSQKEIERRDLAAFNRRTGGRTSAQRDRDTEAADIAEFNRRGTDPSHARKKTAAQLNREISHALRSRRGR